VETECVKLFKKTKNENKNKIMLETMCSSLRKPGQYVEE
jgi:hypothetical protein